MRARRVLTTWLVAALTMALSFTLLAGPAQAGWVDVNPPPSAGGGNSGSQGGANGNYHCGSWLPGQNAGALYYKLQGAWYRYWEYGYSSCVGQGSSTLYNETGYSELCPAGFLVYRFYGSVNNPAAAVTRSQTNLTDWCSPESTYAFPAANPLDAGVDVGSPWKAQLGVNPSQINNGAPSYHFMRNDAGLLAPSWPTQVSGQCSSLQTEGTLRNWYNSATPTEQIALRAALGSDYWHASEGGQYQASGLAEAGLRYASGYRFNWDAWLVNKNVAPAYDPNGNSYYLTSFDWEDRPCASPFQFMASSATAAEDKTVIGTCYVPTLRKRTQLVHVRTGAISWKWGAVQRSTTQRNMGDGERISMFYANREYTPGGPGGDTLEASVTGLNGGQQDALIKGWRNAMVADYRNWANAGITNSQGAQVVPVNPYPGEFNASLISKATNVDINAAADALYNGARCRVGTSVQFDVPVASAAPEVGASLNVAMSNVEVLQVSATEAQIRLSANSLLCNGAACPSTVSLKSLSWDSAVTGTNGFKICSASSTATIPTGCDGVVAASTVSSGGIQRSQTYKLRFANPTEAREAVAVTMTNLRGQYNQSIKTSGLQIQGISPITGRPYTIDTGPLDATITKDLPITASGTPTKLTAIPGGYQATFPVIGAVQVPTGKH